jgi:hypothetical protein
MRITASSMVRLLHGRKSGLMEMQRLVLPAYLAGGAVMTIASIFNPISPRLVLLSGAGASFGLNSGLLFLPAIVDRNGRGQSILTERISIHLLWLVLAAIFGGIFIISPNRRAPFCPDCRSRVSGWSGSNTGAY